MAMPSLAIIDPSRTKEISYNLHIAGELMENQLLTCSLDGNNSEPVRTVETGLIYAMHKMVSGKKINDIKLHNYVEKIYQHIVTNGASVQKVYAIETIQGVYQILPNLEALMMLKIHDMCYGTNYYTSISGKVLSFIEENLIDKETGLFNEFYKNGSFGIENEKLSGDAAWHSTELKASTNGLAIPFMHYFNKEGAEVAWIEFKKKFSDEIMAYTREDFIDGTGHSYLSQLSPKTEAVYGAMLAAREMNDKDFFEQIQKRVLEIGEPCQREGKIFYDGLGTMKVLQAHFILFARVHIGWNRIFNNDWQAHYAADYNIVR